MGPVTALATEVFLGDPARCADSKASASYVGMIPREYSSGERQRLGGLSKQGNPLLRFLWGEAGAHAVCRDPELKCFYRRKLAQKSLGKASVAVARKLGIRLLAPKPICWGNLKNTRPVGFDSCSLQIVAQTPTQTGAESLHPRRD